MACCRAILFAISAAVCTVTLHNSFLCSVCRYFGFVIAPNADSQKQGPQKITRTPGFSNFTLHARGSWSSGDSHTKFQHIISPWTASLTPKRSFVPFTVTLNLWLLCHIWCRNLRLNQQKSNARFPSIALLVMRSIGQGYHRRHMMPAS